MRATLAAILMAIVPIDFVMAGEHFACNAKALSTAERGRYQELTRLILPAIQEKQELKNGYGFRLPARSLMNAAECVSFERRCCPFFTFELEVPRDEGPVWLRVMGAEGVKGFIREAFQP
jgi:hypothetical protein